MAPRRKFLASAARIVDRYSSGAVACNKNSSRTLHRAYAVSLLFLASKASLREVRKLASMHGWSTEHVFGAPGKGAGSAMAATQTRKVSRPVTFVCTFAESEHMLDVSISRYVGMLCRVV